MRGILYSVLQKYVLIFLPIHIHSIVVSQCIKIPKLDQTPYNYSFFERSFIEKQSHTNRFSVILKYGKCSKRLLKSYLNVIKSNKVNILIYICVYFVPNSTINMCKAYELSIKDI